MVIKDLKTFGIDLITKIEREFPPNFFQLITDQFKTVDGLGKITMVLALFFSFNFYAYIYISAGLMELQKERLQEEKLVTKWSDLFCQSQCYLIDFNSPSLNSKPHFTNFDETLPVKNEKNQLDSWNTDALIFTRFYTGINGLNKLSIQQYAAEGAVALEIISNLRDELTTPLFQKPDTSFFSNVLYLLWLPLSLDAKNRLLEYKRKELGEIVLEILHKKASYTAATQFQNVFSGVFLTNNFKSRRFVTKNLQLLIVNGGLKINLRK
jgi:hypothetical protein